MKRNLNQLPALPLSFHLTCEGKPRSLKSKVDMLQDGKYKDEASELLKMIEGYSWDKELQEKYVNKLEAYLKELERVNLIP